MRKIHNLPTIALLLIPFYAYPGGFLIQNHTLSPLIEQEDFIAGQWTSVQNHVTSQELGAPSNTRCLNTLTLTTKSETPLHNLSIMAQYYEPFVSTIHYGDDQALGDYANLEASLRSEALFLGLKYNLPIQGFSLLFGNELVTLNKNSLLNTGVLGSASIKKPKITMRQAYAIAYSYPELSIDLLVSYTPSSSYSQPTENSNNALIASPAHTKFPSIYTLQVQMPLSSSTLFTASYQYESWKNAQLSFPTTEDAQNNHSRPAQQNISDFENSKDFTVGITQKITPAWALSFGGHYAPKQSSTAYSLLSQLNGSITGGIRLTYLAKEGRLSVRSAYRAYGDRTIPYDPGSGQSIRSLHFKKNYSVITDISGRYHF